MYVLQMRNIHGMPSDRKTNTEAATIRSSYPASHAASLHSL
jgi:hypothetical protein